MQNSITVLRLFRRLFSASSSNSNASMIACPFCDFACVGAKWDYTRMVNIKFVTPEGTEVAVSGPTGQDLLSLAHENDVDLEGTQHMI